MIHYQMALEEHKAARGGYVDPDRYREGHKDFQPEMICRTGDGHAVGSRDWTKVTCDRCLIHRPRPTYAELRRETVAKVNRIGGDVGGYGVSSIAWLSKEQRSRLNAPNFMTSERWAYRMLANRTILAEISYGDFMGEPLLGLTVFHRDEASRDWDMERSKACHSVDELVEALKVLDAGREAVA